LKSFESHSPGTLRACPGIALPLKVIFQLPPRTRESKGVKFAVPLNISTTVRSACGEFSEAEIYGLMSSHNLKMELALSSEKSVTKYFLLFFLRNKIRLRIDSFLPRKYLISTGKGKQLRMQREIFVVYFEDDTKHMNKTGEETEIFNVKGRGICKLSCVIYRVN
jgi:hypothetical protein